MSPRIVVLLSGLATHGGIQRYNRTLCKALMEYANDREARLEILSLHDPPGWYNSRYLAQPLAGFSGERFRFCLRALAALSKPCDLVIVGHVDLGPLAAPSRRLQLCSAMLTLTYGIEVWSRVPRHKHIALQASDRIWTISNYTADQLISIQNVHRRSIQVVPVPIDPDFYADITTLPAAPTPFVHTRLLSISRLNATETDKGIDQVILALPNVRRRIPDVNYIVIGDGADRQRLERLATTVGVQDIVQFVGRVPDQQLYAYLSGTDLFVLPSRKEGFGIVFIEAMACGKAVIAGAHGGSPEVIVNGETGILVRHGDQVALASAITSLLQDDQKRQAMGDAGRRRIASVYSYNHFRLRVQETLDLLLCNRSK